MTDLAPSGFDRCSNIAGHTVPVDNTVQPALELYRSLEVSLKISGHGGFDPVPFLGDALYMAYVEPNSLLHGAPVREPSRGLLQLAKPTFRIGDEFMLSPSVQRLQEPGL